jgi:hypothetical protein
MTKKKYVPETFDNSEKNFGTDVWVKLPLEDDSYYLVLTDADDEEWVFTHTALVGLEDIGLHVCDEDTFLEWLNIHKALPEADKYFFKTEQPLIEDCCNAISRWAHGR